MEQNLVIQLFWRRYLITYLLIYNLTYRLVIASTLVLLYVQCFFLKCCEVVDSHPSILYEIRLFLNFRTAFCKLLTKFKHILYHTHPNAKYITLLCDLCTMKQSNKQNQNGRLIWIIGFYSNVLISMTINRQCIKMNSIGKTKMRKNLSMACVCKSCICFCFIRVRMEIPCNFIKF